MHDETSGDRADTTSEMAPESSPPLGRRFDVGGRRLALHRTGTGSPAVVLLAGGGAVGMDYLNIQKRAAELTTRVLYDRGGTGWSDHVELPRGLAETTDELRALLRTAGIPAPYVLVGHSLGGLYARHFAQRFPAETAALVLLDPAHEDYNAYMPHELVERWKEWDPDQALPDELPAEVIQHYRDLFAREIADWPDAIREPLIERHVSRAWLQAGFNEARNVEQLYDEVRRGGPLPDVPLIVLSSTGIDAFKRAVSVGESESLLREEIEGKHRLYRALAESVQRGEIRLVDAGHATIHYRQPSAVLQAIRDLLDRLSA